MYRERVIVLFLAVFTVWLWWPRVEYGLPYFYEEDEAHHFNRTVEMVKSGDLNPHYFHKPSLHFYLRIPAIALSFLNEVRVGRAKKVDDIITRDPAGVGGYAFSTSHPGIVKAARLVSVVCGVVVVLCVYAILLCLTGNVWWGVYGALLTLGSTLLYQYGAEVGVDIVTAACVLACCAVAVWGKGSAAPYRASCVSSLLAGLAIGAKYNSAPVVFIPFYSMVRCRCTTWPGTIVKWLRFCVLLGLGFLLSSPYVVSSLPLFLNQVAYEVWHYGIAGHEGHMSEPGLAHFLLYLKDLSFNYFGFGPVLLGLMGLVYLGWKGEFLAVLFPVIYLWYMSDQRAHFIRNMVVIVPFLGIGAAFGLSTLSAFVRSVALRNCVYAIGGLVVLQAYTQLFLSRAAGTIHAESRMQAAEWLRSVESSKGVVRLAIDSSLQFEPNLRLDLPGRAVKLENTSHEQLFLNGFDGVLVAQAHRVEGSAVVEQWSGGTDPQRIVQNPWIGAVMFDSAWQRDRDASLSALGQVLPVVGSPEWSDFSGTEQWLWVQKRRARLPVAFPGMPVPLWVSVMTPWEGQTMTIDGQPCHLGSVGEWSACRILIEGPSLEITIGKVGILPGGGDSRVLGVAIRGPQLE